jgi:hypothetical protein
MGAGFPGASDWIAPDAGWPPRADTESMGVHAICAADSPPASAAPRFTVPTCIGCGAMARPATCESGCAERELVLVRAAAHDSLAGVAAAAEQTIELLGTVCEQLRGVEPAGDPTGAYQRLQASARGALHAETRVPRPGLKIEEPAEPAATWWCSDCGGLEAPQPCLGICVWRPVDWVERELYERERQRVLTREQLADRMRGLTRRLAYATPRPGGWQASLYALRAEAADVLAAG